jgi:hypothetical protein
MFHAFVSTLHPLCILFESTLLPTCFLLLVVYFVVEIASTYWWLIITCWFATILTTSEGDAGSPCKSTTLQIINKSVLPNALMPDHCIMFHLPELAISWTDTFLATAVVNPVSALGPTLLNLQMASTGLAESHARWVHDDDSAIIKMIKLIPWADWSCLVCLHLPTPTSSAAGYLLDHKRK